MKIVIPCAAGKVPVECGDFNGFMRDSKHRSLIFVGDPKEAPNNGGLRYVSPDCNYKSNETFRNKLCSYNDKFKSRGYNPDNLLPAYKLYENSIYRELVESEIFGMDRVYILSAGWGIVKANFLLPMYDITFSSGRGNYNWQSRRIDFSKFYRLDDTCNETVEFIGTSNYVKMFEELTKDYYGDKLIYVNSKNFKNKGFIDCKVDRKKHRFWHYECARRKLNSCCDCKKHAERNSSDS